MRAIYSVILFVALLTSCPKPQLFAPLPKPQLPDETQSGKQTFGFLLNDSLWLPKVSIFGPVPYYYISYEGFILRMAFNRKNNPEDATFDLVCGNIFKDTTINFKSLTSINKISLTERYKITDIKDSVIFYNSTRQDDFILQIKKFDTINHIVSGTFEGTLRDTIKNKIAKIKLGRFDMKYKN